MTEAVLRLEAALGRRASRVSSVAIACGAGALALGLATGRARSTLAALAASWLFFAGLATGSLAVVAAVRLARGRWAGPILPIAESTAGALDSALVVLVILLAGSRTLLPWAADAGAGRLALLAVRQLVPTTVLFAAGARLVRTGPDAGAPGRGAAAAVVYLVAYAVALSLWAYDWVLALSSGPPPTVLPAFYFLGAFLSGLAWIALVAAARGVGGEALRHDLGKLLFGFVTVWAYLLWAIYLTTWYGNVPAEVGPLLARWSGPYRPISAGVFLAVFAGPFGLFLAEGTKRRRGTLLLGAAAVLAGLLADRFLLVLPSLELRGDAIALVAGAGVTVGVAGLFALGVGGRAPAGAGARRLGGPAQYPSPNPNGKSGS